ncbi:MULTISPECIES: hypothetical protein [Nocardia]|uniref:Uncharacterized protein n=1 Tax=Nocardia aurea TaxID=2144174 RepID=A0ABV3FWU5_9NOCA|nr:MULTISPECIES: hypothetical protein [Nocardia]
MTDRSTSSNAVPGVGEVSDADLAEQSTPVSPDDAEQDEQVLADAVDADTWHADVADIVDQAIEVPPDDESFELSE